MKEKGLMGTSVPLRANHSSSSVLLCLLSPCVSMSIFVNARVICWTSLWTQYFLKVALMYIRSQLVCVCVCVCVYVCVFYVGLCLCMCMCVYGQRVWKWAKFDADNNKGNDKKRKKTRSLRLVLVFVLSWSISVLWKRPNVRLPLSLHKHTDTQTHTYTHTCFTYVPLNDNFFHKKSIRHQQHKRGKGRRRKKRIIKDETSTNRNRIFGRSFFLLYCSLAINVSSLFSLFICNYIFSFFFSSLLMVPFECHWSRGLSHKIKALVMNLHVCSVVQLCVPFTRGALYWNFKYFLVTPFYCMMQGKIGWGGMETKKRSDLSIENKKNCEVSHCVMQHGMRLLMPYWSLCEYFGCFIDSIVVPSIYAHIRDLTTNEANTREEYLRDGRNHTILLFSWCNRKKKK